MDVVRVSCRLIAALGPDCMFLLLYFFCLIHWGLCLFVLSSSPHLVPIILRLQMPEADLRKKLPLNFQLISVDALKH